MLTLVELKLNNFLSHADTRVSFAERSRLLIDGKSGAGKSSLVEAVIWALYGKGRSNNRNLISKRASRGGVTLILDMVEHERKTRYRIERTINGSKHELVIESMQEDGSYLPIPVAGLTALERFIETDITHASYALFVNSVVYPQDNSQTFVLQTAVRRKELLLELANIAQIDEYAERTKQAIALREAELSSKEGVMSVYEAQAAELGVQVAALPELRESAKVAQVTALAAKAEYDAVWKDMLEARGLAISANQTRDEWQNLKYTKIPDAQLAIHGLNEDLGKLTTLKESGKETLIESVRKTTELTADVEGLRAAFDKMERWQKRFLEIQSGMPVDLNYGPQIAAVEREIARHHEFNDQELTTPYHCPACNVAIDRTDVLPSLKTVVQGRQAALQEMEGRLKSLIEQRDDYNNRAAISRLALEALGERPLFDGNALSDKQAELMQGAIELETLRANLLNADVRISELSTALAQKNEELGALQARLESLAEASVRAEAAQTALSMVEQRVEATAAHHNRAVMGLSEANAALKTMEDNALKLENNKALLAELTGKTANLKEELAKLTLLKEAFGANGVKAVAVDYLLPRLEEGINEVLAQLSDFRVELATTQPGVGKDTRLEGLFITIYNELGEAFDFDNYSGGEKLKVIVAIAEALAKLQRASFRIVDELFVGLDEESAAAFADVLSRIQDRFQQLICISHMRIIKDLFTEAIVVTKRDGVSTATSSYAENQQSDQPAVQPLRRKNPRKAVPPPGDNQLVSAPKRKRAAKAQAVADPEAVPDLPKSV